MAIGPLLPAIEARFSGVISIATSGLGDTSATPMNPAQRALMNRTSAVGLMLDFACGRRPADAKASPGHFKPISTTSAGPAATPLLALVAASTAWWESRRPPGWTLEQHVADPTAGCDGTAQERALAEVVAH
jgi:hypothetical protein